MKAFTARAESDLIKINAHSDLQIQNQLQNPVDVGFDTLRAARERCRHYFDPANSQFNGDILTGITEVKTERLSAIQALSRPRSHRKRPTSRTEVTSNKRTRHDPLSPTTAEQEPGQHMTARWESGTGADAER